MIILDRKYTIKELNEQNSFVNGFVKGVVDLKQELVALDADMHYEYDSFINIHNNQLHGFPRGGMGILDPDIRAKATEVIYKWIQF